MSYVLKLTGEDLSHYLNKIESVCLRRAFMLAPDWQSDCRCCKMFTFACPISWQL